MSSREIKRKTIVSEWKYSCLWILGGSTSPSPLDSILSCQAIDEIESHEETCSQLNADKISSPDTSKVEEIEKCPGNTEMHEESIQNTSRRSLVSISKKQSDIFRHFWTDLCLFEKPPAVRHHLGKHENWIADAAASYRHPFETHPHRSCPSTTMLIDVDLKTASNRCWWSNQWLKISVHVTNFSICSILCIIHIFFTLLNDSFTLVFRALKIIWL